MGDTMKRKDHDHDDTCGDSVADAPFTDEDRRFARKVSIGATDLLDQARASLATATEAYAAGDPQLARVLLAEARQLADLRAELPEGRVLETMPDLSVQLSAADGLVAACDSLLPLLQPEVLFQLTDKKLKESFAFKKGGTFNKKGKLKNTNSLTRTINLFFWLDKDQKCSNYCMISVFCFLKKDKNGKYKEIVKPAVDGFTEFYKFLYERMEEEGKKRKSGLPHDGKDVGGYAVDTPFFLPDTKGNPAVKCPCYTGQWRINAAGKRDKNGKHIQGEDRPGAKLPGLIEYFETAVLCLDTTPYTVLNSMRWRLRDGGIEIMNKKGEFIKPDKKGTTKLKDEVIDQGDASDAFKRALLDWIDRMKKTHGIKKIECDKDKKSDKKKSADKKKKKD